MHLPYKQGVTGLSPVVPIDVSWYCKGIYGVRKWEEYAQGKPYSTFKYSSSARFCSSVRTRNSCPAFERPSSRVS